jgi:hypothetical protein
MEKYMMVNRKMVIEKVKEKNVLFMELFYKL